MNEGYTATADYQHIDVAPRYFWKPFVDLVSEMDPFVPIPLSEFHEEGLVDKFTKIQRDGITKLNSVLGKKKSLQVPI